MGHKQAADAPSASGDEILGTGYDATAHGGADRALDGVARLHGLVASLFAGFAVALFFLPWWSWTETVRPPGAGPDGERDVVHTLLGLELAPWQLTLSVLGLLLCVAVAWGKGRHLFLGLAALLFLGAYLLEIHLPREWGSRTQWPIDVFPSIVGGAVLIAGMGALSTWRAPRSGPRKRLRGS